MTHRKQTFLVFDFDILPSNIVANYVNLRGQKNLNMRPRNSQQRRHFTIKNLGKNGHIIHTFHKGVFLFLLFINDKRKVWIQFLVKHKPLFCLFSLPLLFHKSCRGSFLMQWQFTEEEMMWGLDATTWKQRLSWARTHTQAHVRDLSPDTSWLITSLGRSLCLNFLVFKSCFLWGSLPFSDVINSPEWGHDSCRSLQTGRG